MNRIIFLLFIALPIWSFGQIENRWQPDSIYSNRQVKKIYVYLNSKKDLSEIVEFDQTGKRIRSTKYSSSYNRRTRKSKKIEKIYYYHYDSLNRLTKIIDSTKRDSTNFKYGKNDNLISSRKNLGNFEYKTKYYYDPFVSTTTRKRDSIIVYHKTKEYDKDFYVKKFFGYVLTPTRKESNVMYFDKDSIVTEDKFSYSDYDDLKRFDENKVIKNQFDENNRLIESNIKSEFLNDRINEYDLYYDYYQNGLLKSVGGYIPRYFKYEYWE
jgi:hypothetical protein